MRGDSTGGLRPDDVGARRDKWGVRPGDDAFGQRLPHSRLGEAPGDETVPTRPGSISCGGYVKPPVIQLGDSHPAPLVWPHESCWLVRGDGQGRTPAPPDSWNMQAPAW